MLLALSILATRPCILLLVLYPGVLYHNYPLLLLSPFALSYTSTLNQHHRLQLSIHLWARSLQEFSSDIARSAIVLTIFVVHFPSFRRRCKFLLLRRPMYPVVTWRGFVDFSWFTCTHSAGVIACALPVVFVLSLRQKNLIFTVPRPDGALYFRRSL